jgi:hypothetical protein
MEDTQGKIVLDIKDGNALLEYLSKQPLRETYALFNMLAPKVNMAMDWHEKNPEKK